MTRTWDGTISGPEFQVAAKELQRVWNSCSDDCIVLPLVSSCQWQWQACASSTGRGYLILDNVLLHSEKDIEVDVKLSRDEQATDYEFVDAATLVDCVYPIEQYWRYSFHVVYSETYKVPVLLFRGYFPDGRPLEWKDIEKGLPEGSLCVSRKFRWTFVTQEDHPFLHQPWFLLHPCGTSDLMIKVLSKSATHIEDLRNESDKEESASTFWYPSSYDRTIDRRCSDGEVTKSQIELDTAATGDFSLQGCPMIEKYLLSWFSFTGALIGLKVSHKMFLTK